MALYEANFIKLRQLVPHLDSFEGTHVSVVAGDSDLHVSIDKRSKYTCELRLTYLFPEDGGLVADPDLVARVYFDARMAEVKGWINGHRHQLLRDLGHHYRPDLDACWSRNMVFSKWLEYLQERGHHLSPTA